MNFELFIAKRLIKKQEKKSVGNVIRIATVAVTLSIAVMLVSLSILTGFKNSIKDKITGFGSHIQIVPFVLNGAYSDTPIYLDERLTASLKSCDNVKSITPVLNKSAAVITDGDFLAAVLKGITSTYDTTFFHDALLKGNCPKLHKESKQEVLVSETVAKKMQLSVGDKIKVYFYIEDNYRSKNFYISGIYDTGLGDYDEHFIICDASVLQNIFSLDDKDYSAYEISLKDFSSLEASADEIYSLLPQNMTVQTITEMETNLFSWLNLLDSNVVMIILIMLLVTIVTLSGVILIMIYQSKQMIGVMKSFGTPNKSIMKIFLCKASWVTLKGIIYGNILAVVLELVQKYGDLIKLDPQSYYLTSVPVNINVAHILLIDVIALVVCFVCMIIPARSISKISVVKNLKFE